MVLVASDDWGVSAPDTAHITVADSQPQTLAVTLTPTALWPPNHRMVRINATVTATDACGNGTPSVVLTSITSNPDDGSGDGHTGADIQEASLGTLDLSFLVRSERAGPDPGGRIYTVTYTATDGAGHQTRASATVSVSHPR